jgi:hypothetical protein
LKKEGLSPRTLEFAVMKRQAKHAKMTKRKPSTRKSQRGIERTWRERKGRH